MNPDPNRAGVRGDAALALLGLIVHAGAGPDDSQAEADGRRPVENVEEAGRRVTAARETSGLTGTELGAYVGLGADQVREIESGRRPLTVRELPAFAEALGVSIRHLLGSSD